MNEMHVVLIASQKGGAGKTTLALHLATALDKAGQSVVIFDIDPQGSAIGWKESRRAETPAVVAVQPNQVNEALDLARKFEADVVVIDTPPHAEIEPAVLKAADLVLIPCRPGILDLRAIGATVEAVKHERKPAVYIEAARGRLPITEMAWARSLKAIERNDPKKGEPARDVMRVPAYVILNAAPPNAPKLIADAVAAIEQGHGVKVCPVVLHQYADYTHALTAGLAVTEFAEKGKAAAEIETLVAWLYRQYLLPDPRWRGDP